jgi:hypothetical protein
MTKPISIIFLIQTIHPISMKSTNVRASIIALLAIPSFLIFPNSSIAQKRDFTFHNRTGATIQSLFVSSPSETDWGDDRLGSDVLSPNDSVTMDNYTSPPDCLQDFKVRFSNDAEVEIRGVDTCENNKYYLL